MRQLTEALTTGGVGVPWLYVKGRICERFHCLPSQLANENMRELMWLIDMLALGDQLLSKRVPKG